MSGRYFDQWTVGDTIAHPIHRTVTETDNLLFTAMTHNPQPLHLDAEAAAASEFGQILRSEEHTSELQSLMRISYAVFCLKKKNKYTKIITKYQQNNNTRKH